MASKKRIADEDDLTLLMDRLCHQLLENHTSFEQSVLLGIQPDGKALTLILQERLAKWLKTKPLAGFLDVTFHRDDFRRREKVLQAHEMNVPFSLENKRVILVDDVLFTGRTVRAALDAMITFGRPAQVELLVLVDRKYSRHLPISATYKGIEVNSTENQYVLVEWKMNGAKENQIWLTDKV